VSVQICEEEIEQNDEYVESGTIVSVQIRQSVNVQTAERLESRSLSEEIRENETANVQTAERLESRFVSEEIPENETANV
jgi:hypothetical protein